MNSILILTTTISEVINFGPSIFIMLNQEEILWNYVLIGHHSNELIVNLLQNKNSFLNFDMLTSWFDKHSKENIYERSGYDLDPALFWIGKDILSLIVITLIGTIIIAISLGLSKIIKKPIMYKFRFWLMNFFLLVYPFRYGLEWLLKW